MPSLHIYDDCIGQKSLGHGDHRCKISAPTAEVVVFTAGLEDYAAPICNALESRYGKFAAKLFRPATVTSDVYPCVKVR